MLSTVLTAVGVMGGITILLATVLLIASRRLYVQEDPRLDAVEQMLPQNNCGGCGFPSCRMFAEALVSAEALPGKCTVSSEQERIEVATFLDVDPGTEVKRVARLACAGGTNVATVHAMYRGQQTCSAAAQVVGGGKTCTWGCIGSGDCERVCDFNAIHMNEHSLPVVNEALCTACGDCVTACPKGLFSLEPIDQHLWVTCKNQQQGNDILEYCQVACTACERCAVDAPKDVIHMASNLPVVDYLTHGKIAKSPASKVAIERCPTGAIVWIDQGVLAHGAAAQTVVRHSSRKPDNS